MTKIYSSSVPIEADIVDAFCIMQKGFTDQFVYYDKARPCRYMGLGRCIALPSLRDVEWEAASGAHFVGEAGRCSSRSIASTPPTPPQPTS